MEMTSTRIVPAPVDTVWAALNDPVMLTNCIPGCEAILPDGENAYTISIAAPLTLPPNSSAAIFAASTEPAPEFCSYGPERSVSTPILTLFPEICAEAGDQAAARATMATHKTMTNRTAFLPRLL